MSSDERTVRTPRLKKALEALDKDSTYPHEKGCTCDGCAGTRTMDDIVGGK